MIETTIGRFAGVSGETIHTDEALLMNSEVYQEK
jgi:hypothetical protein